MAVVCNINKNSDKYRTLKQMSGISESKFDLISSGYMSKYGRLPYLDEIPNANSEAYIKDVLKIKTTKDSNYTNIKNILNYTGVNNIEEANVKLNDIFRDKIIELIPIGETVLVNITERPSQFKLNNNLFVEQTDIVNMKVSINNMLNRMKKLYGISIIPITNEELSSKDWSFIKDKTVQGFIYDGNIYINLDVASKDTPIHELSHILLGSLKFTDPQLYLNILNTVDNLPNREYLAKGYLNRSRNDINEEIFILLFANYLTGNPSIFENLDNELLFYDVTRVLDNMLEGNNSVRSVSDIFSKSIQKLSNLVGSKMLNIYPAVSLDLASINRSLANVKELLFKNNELEERCK